MTEVRADQKPRAADPSDVGGGILDAGDARQLGQALHGLGQNIDDGARRDVVDNDGNIGGIVQRLKMLIKTLLIRSIVIARDMQDGIRARGLGMLGQRDCLGRIIGAGTRYNRYPSRRLLDHDLNYPAMLFMRQGGAFPRGATRDNAVGALFNMPIDKFAQRSFIYLAVAERCNKRNNRSLEHVSLLGECYSGSSAANLTLSPAGGQAARTPIRSFGITLNIDLNPAPARHGAVRAAAWLFVVLLLTGLLLPLALPNGRAWAQTESNLLSPPDRALYRKAFQAAKKGDWFSAHRLAEKAKDPLPAKALRWLNFRQPGTRATFSEIGEFLDNNPAWPSRDRLIRRAEEAMVVGRIKDPIALEWFTLHRPLSGPGQIRLAEAMFRNGMEDDGLQWLRYAWINNVFRRRESRVIFRRHRNKLTQADHMARLDHMLWQGHRHRARGLYSLVPSGYHKVAEARESLMVGAPGVDSKVAAVPSEYLDDSGLAYERLRWRRRKKLDERAREILLRPPDNLGPQPKKWWIERHIQARGTLREGQAKLAYRLASEHGQLAGEFSYAQAEWLSGWIALRLLDDATSALQHFGNLYGNVKFPVSRARAAYWAGRANMALGKNDDGEKWYNAAAWHPSTYYGQLAIEALSLKGHWRMPEAPSPSIAVKRAFNGLELVRLSHMLVELGQGDYLRPIILHLTRSATNPEERLQAARLAQGLGHSTLAVQAAKLSLRAGTLLPRTGYPMLENLAPMPIEAALAHAVTRQESEFNRTAISSASARGLMQLLPRTARKVAKGLRVRYSQDRLFDGPYNMRLGSAYLSKLIKHYDGSYLMAIAAYNGGPSRVNRWLRQYGDPRTDTVDPIDWVESIPISETRNYVQRVLENLQIYRWRFNPATAKLGLSDDLHRGHKRKK